MSTEAERLRFAELLQEVDSGRRTSQQALSQARAWAGETPWADKILLDAYHFLMHFHEDSDIRAGNQKYADGQVEGLIVWAERLKKASNR